MLQGEHSSILLTFIKLPFVIKIFILSIFECPFYTGFTVLLFWKIFVNTLVGPFQYFCSDSERNMPRIGLTHSHNVSHRYCIFVGSC